MVVTGDARRKAVRRLVRPTRIDHLPREGPLTESMHRSSQELLAVPNNSVVEWYTAARAYWHTLGAGAHRENGPKFRWEPAAGPIAHQSPGASRVTMLLHSVVKNLREAARIGEKIGPWSR